MKRFKKAECPFCDSSILSSAFMESSNFIVVYNHAPILPGHSLVIPKTHIESLLDLSDLELLEFVQLSRDAAKLLLKVFNAEAFNWTIQERPAAGQTIPHLHLHIFPRHDNDFKRPGDWYPVLIESERNQYIDSEQRIKLDSVEINKIVSHIKSFLS